MTGSGRPSEKPRSAKSRLPLGLAGGGLAVALLAGTWLLLRPTEEPPETRLRAALANLDRPNDPAAWEAARRVAERVLESGFRPPDFPGEAEFILGIAANRGKQVDGEAQPRHAAAVDFLRASETQGMDESRRPEWSFALGTSLFALRRFEAARPLLEEAWWRFPGRDGKVVSGLALAEIDLERPGGGSVVSIEQVIDELAARGDLSAGEKRRLLLIRTRAALRSGKLGDAAAALSEVESRDPQAADVALLRAEILLADGRADEARRRLVALSQSEGGDAEPSRTAAAAYLLGRSEQSRGDSAAAERAFERAADSAPASADGIRGALAAAALLQQAGRDEEAFGLFRRAVTSQADGDPPPLPGEEVRRAVRAGWDAWTTRAAFDRAVSLAAAAEPVLGRVESTRLQAQGRERAATAADEAWQDSSESGQPASAKSRDDRWRESGEAYRNLAAAVSESAAIGEALWTAAEHLRRGRAFGEADAVLTELLDLRLPRLEAAVLARRGQVRLDLGRPDAAAEDFGAIVDRHPKDPEAFEARFLLGRCHLERGDSEGARRAWREVLALADLTPAAAEWRLALFSLAELLHRQGAVAVTRANRGGAGKPVDAAAQAAAVAALDEAIALYGDFARRASDSERVVEARVFRADALRRRAEMSLSRSATAETESLKEVHVREAEKLLSAAVAELRTVQGALAPLDDEGRLPPLGRELLKTTAFDLGHAYSALGRHREAVVAYGAAVNRYPEDARVLPAYLRMAESYRGLDRADDARAAVEQARLVLGQMPAPALAAGSALTREDWEEWLARAKNTPAGSSDP